MKSYSFKINGKQYDVSVGPAEGKILPVRVNGADYQVELESAPAADPAAPAAAPVAAPAAPQAPAQATPAPAPAAPAGGRKVTTPMPGVIIEICVREGQAVHAGEKVAILEAMKMENEIPAPADGTVAQIHVSKGASVGEGDLIVTLA